MSNEFFNQDQQPQTLSLKVDGGFKCSSCGANMSYDADTQKLTCAYCGVVKEIEKDTNVTERDFAELELHKFDTTDNIKTITCQNCGATEILKQDAVAAKCPFCDSPLVVDTQDIDLVKPDSMIPFAFGQDKAKEYCSKWLKKRWFATREFKRIFKLHVPQGIYYPIWTFDSQTLTHYYGRLGKTYTTHRRDSKGNTHTETHIRWFNVNGSRQDSFDDVIINASTFIEDKTIFDLQPFPRQSYVVYSNEYLAGYLANRYTVDPFSAFGSAQEKMRNFIKTRIVNSYNADHVDYLNLDVNHLSKSFKSTYVPVYMSKTKYKEKLYHQFINGATGKIVGKYPKSVVKILSVVLVALGIVGALVYLFLKYGN